jgi:hypothetical protein
MRFPGFLLAAPLLGLLACSGSAPEVRACTMIGCSDGLTVTVANAPPAAYTVEVILPDGSVRSGRCEVAAQCANGVFVENVSAEQVTVRIVSGASSSSQVVRPQYTVSQPNGPDCPPTCRQARAQVQYTG